MVEKVKKYNLEHNLLSKKDRIVVGVSGGADSVCLLLVLYELRKSEDYYLKVVHINHMIRGKAADEDETYVRALCEERNIDFEARKIDIQGLSEKEGISLEEAGRKARYDTFLEVCERDRCNKIAIAHNRNDNAETFLFHLFRGSGLAGLSGIRPVREIHTKYQVTVIRPLLFTERKEIEDYLNENKIPYQTDQTNFENIYTRNMIRNQILPIAKEINQNAILHVEAASNTIGEVYDYLVTQTENVLERCVIRENTLAKIEINLLTKEPLVLQKMLIREVIAWLTSSLKDIESKHIMEIITLAKKQVGKSIDLPYGLFARKDYTTLVIGQKEGSTKQKESKYQVEILPYGEYLLPNGCKVKFSILEDFIPDEIPKKKYTKWFDYDKIENTVEIRTRREGDILFIKTGRKKLKGLLIDAKIPSQDRNNVLLMSDGSDIIWILDERLKMRISEKYKVTKHTKRVLCAELTNVEASYG